MHVRSVKVETGGSGCARRLAAAGAAVWAIARGVLLAGALVVLPPARAALAGPWVANGPVGGSATALAFDPTAPATIYAGTNGGGIFKSSDGGVTWSAQNATVPALATWVVEALAVDPATPSRVYAALSSGADGGVLSSSDAGATWTLHALGAVHDLAIDPATPSTLWAVGNVIAKSTDAGATWTELVTANDFRSVAIDPTAPAVVYVGTLFGAVEKTIDGGAHWTTLATGLASDQVEALAIDPATPGTVYAGLQDFGVYKSDDGGMSWSAVGPTVGTTQLSIEDLAVDPGSPETVYAAGFVPGTAPSPGVFKSTDGGASWTGTPLEALVRALVIDPTSPARLFAGTQDGHGLWRTDDAATSWSVANDGLVNTSVGALATAPSAELVVYAAAGNAGVFRSDDGGTTFARTAFTGEIGLFPSLAVDPTTASTVFLGDATGGVFKTVDGGASWQPIDQQALPLLVDALLIDPTSPAIVYAGGFGGVARSTTGGDDWTLVNTGLVPFVTALAIDPTAPATLYAAAAPLMGPTTAIFKTTDAGAHWEPASTGLPGSPGRSVAALALDPQAPATVYAAVEGAGVYRTSDGGATWQAASDGLVAGESVADVRALAVDPIVPGTVYAGTAGQGVFVTTNGGATWVPTNVGLDNPFVRSLAIEPGRLYAGTAGRGAFVREIATEPAQAILGRSFVVKDPQRDDASRRKITVAAAGAPGAPALDADALLAGGATLTVTAEGAELASQTFVLPAAGWSRSGTQGVKYSDRQGVHGPVASVVLKRSTSGSVKLAATVLGKLGHGAAPAVTIVPPDPGVAGGVRLEPSAGGAGYCAAFGGDAGGIVRNDGARSFAVTKPAAAGCP